MILRIRTMRYILVGVSALLFTVAGIGYWLAVYHERYSGLSVDEATALTATIFALGGLVGTFGGGWLADRSKLRTRAAESCWWCGPRSRARSCSRSRSPSTTSSRDSHCSSSASPPVPAPRPRSGLRCSTCFPRRSRGVGTSTFALVSTVLGTALAPPLVGLLSDLTSLVTAFYIVFPPIIVGVLFLLRARHTVADDAQAIITAMLKTDAVATEHEERPAPVE